MVPTNDGELVGGGGTGGESAFESCGRKEVEFGGDFARAGRDIHVKRESVEQVAAPFQSLAAGEKFQAGEIDDRAVGSVFAGNPLRVVEREVAGAGWNFQRGVEDFAGSRGGVDRKGDRGRSGRRCCGPGGN